MIPLGRGLRVVGDVHGDAKAFAHAAETDRFVIQLGDLVDDGPDTPGALNIMFRLIDEGRGLFIMGNHDFKLARALQGAGVRGTSLSRTLEELGPETRARALTEILRAPFWLRVQNSLFVHGGFYAGMLHEASPPFPAGRPDPMQARAIYGQTTGRVLSSGRPERLIAWVDDIPRGATIYCGHDRRSSDGRPYIKTNAQGGTAVFLDTGAGKGGHLSWIDLDEF
jgi:protein phosphatase